MRGPRYFYFASQKHRRMENDKMYVTISHVEKEKQLLQLAKGAFTLRPDAIRRGAARSGRIELNRSHLRRDTT
jgi:hypothetical protein